MKDIFMNALKKKYEAEVDVAKATIEVYLHNYSHPNYNQLYGKFNPFACILDLFMNEGENSMKIIRSGRKKTQKLF